MGNVGKEGNIYTQEQSYNIITQAEVTSTVYAKM